MNGLKSAPNGDGQNDKTIFKSKPFTRECLGRFQKYCNRFEMATLSPSPLIPLPLGEGDSRWLVA